MVGGCKTGAMTPTQSQANVRLVTDCRVIFKTNVSFTTFAHDLRVLYSRWAGLAADGTSGFGLVAACSSAVVQSKTTEGLVGLWRSCPQVHQPLSRQPRKQLKLQSPL